MRNAAVFFVLCSILGITVLIGLVKTPSSPVTKQHQEPEAGVPSVGRIQVLNGCGITGAANAAADHLRQKSFDVKNIENARAWNYPTTLVVSRTTEMAMASQVAAALNTNNIVMMRNDKKLYDVTVILGADFAERLE